MMGNMIGNVIDNLIGNRGREKSKLSRERDVEWRDVE